MTDEAVVEAIADDIYDAGQFCLDLEFMTEGRYVAELSLVQVSWGDPESPEVRAIDPLAVPVDAIVELVQDPTTETIVHAAQADLALLSARFNARADALIDTQVAAAFLGFGDQIGYANLVERLSDVVLDKGAQFSQWSKRPLSAEQLSYALDDVRYLPDLWHRMRSELERRGRLDWVTDECARLADGWAQRSLPEEMYRRVRGWNGLKPRAQGALREVAAWREQRSLEQNRPPSWLINDRTLLELCRTPPRDERELVDVRGLGKGMAERHGSVLLDLIARGQADPPPPRPPSARLPDIGEAWPAILRGLVQARCQEMAVAPRFVATRADIDAVIAWWLVGDHSQEPDVPLLRGWRRELAGGDLLDWLSGRTTIVADRSEAGIRIAARSAPAGLR